MRFLFVRLLSVLALAAMPLGMSGTSAATAVPSLGGASAPCGKHEPADEAGTDRLAHCTSCAAVAAPALGAPEKVLMPRAVLADRDQRLLLGILLEVATPPPRLA